MPVPKRRTSKAKRDSRRSHHAMTPPQWSACSNCGERVLPHRVCSACGHYKGRRVLTPKEQD